MSWRRITGPLAGFAARSVRAAVAAVMPCRCVFCGTECRPGEPFVCAGCAPELPWLGPHCPRCAEPLGATPPRGLPCGRCLGHPPRYAAATAAFHYAFPVDCAIRALKFRRRLDYLPAFGPLLAALAGSFAPDADAVVAVPLHWRRQFRRGFNQALELARPVAQARGLVPAAGVQRVRATPYQAGLGAAARRQNLEAAFRVDRSFARRHVLGVDDVRTPGTTRAQLARALGAAGARRVSILALARAAQAGLNA